jgi:toxin YoeB
MNKLFTQIAWEEYTYWQKEDKKMLRKINNLIKDIERNGNEGIGKPEALKHELSGFWSRRIDEKNRLIYSLNDTTINIISCKGHYMG